MIIKAFMTLVLNQFRQFRQWFVNQFRQLLHWFVNYLLIICLGVLVIIAIFLAFCASSVDLTAQSYVEVNPWWHPYFIGAEVTPAVASKMVAFRVWIIGSEIAPIRITLQGLLLFGLFIEFIGFVTLLRRASSPRWLFFWTCSFTGLIIRSTLAFIFNTATFFSVAGMSLIKNISNPEQQDIFLRLKGLLVSKNKAIADLQLSDVPEDILHVPRHTDFENLLSNFLSEYSPQVIEELAQITVEVFTGAAAPAFPGLFVGGLGGLWFFLKVWLNEAPFTPFTDVLHRVRFNPTLPFKTKGWNWDENLFPPKTSTFPPNPFIKTSIILVNYEQNIYDMTPDIKSQQAPWEKPSSKRIPFKAIPPWALALPIPTPKPRPFAFLPPFVNELPEPEPVPQYKPYEYSLDQQNIPFQPDQEEPRRPLQPGNRPIIKPKEPATYQDPAQDMEQPD